MSDIFTVIIEPSQQAAGNGLYKTIPGLAVTNYTHTIQSFGGYDTCQIEMSITKQDLDIFLTHILGSSIRVLTNETETIWEGFVNELSTTYNNTDINIGPLMDIANHLLVKYSDYITGVPGITLYTNDIISQLRYGKFTKILNSSSVSATNAINIRNNYLEENKFPFYNVGLTIQDNTRFSVTLNCLGNYYLLNSYVYNNSLSGSYTVREKIRDVLQAHPNKLFYSHGLIAANTLSVLKLENEDRLALDVIKELVSLGSDTNNDRMLFGVYNNRSVVYKTIPNEVRYHYRSFGNNRYLSNNAGGKVNIASFKPGSYIGISDVPDIMSSSLRSIPKYIFAESVSYTAPFGLTVTGSNISTLAQRVAKLGLGGF